MNKTLGQIAYEALHNASMHAPWAVVREFEKCDWEAIAEAVAAAVQPKWQSIESAPKDEFLLLLGPSGYKTTPFVCATGRTCSDYHVGRWIDHANDDLTDWGFVPTHYMPLPPAPKDEYVCPVPACDECPERGACTAEETKRGEEND